MSPKPIQYLKREASTREENLKEGCHSGKQAPLVQQRPVTDRIRHLNPDISAEEVHPGSDKVGGRMMANGRPAVDLGGSKQMMRGEGFPHQGAGTSLKRRNSHDTRHHQNIPYTDDRKRQRGSQWTNPGPPVNGSPKMRKQSGHMLHDPEVQVVDPAPPSQPSAPSYGRGTHESAHPAPSRRPQQDQKLRSGVMLSRVAPQGSSYNTEQLSAVHEALSQAEEALLEAKNQAQEHMRELPLRLKAFLEEQLASLASACGFAVEFSTPPNGAAGAVYATFLPNSAVSSHAEEPEPLSDTKQPSPQRTKVKGQAPGGGGVRGAAQEPVPATQTAPAQAAQPPAAPPSADVAAVAQGMMPKIMSRVSVPPHVQGNQGNLRSSLKDRLEHDTAAPVCFRFMKDESRETPERGGETPSEGTDVVNDDAGYGEEVQAVPRNSSAVRSSEHRGNGPPRWNPNGAPEDSFGPGRGGDRPPPSGGRSGGTVRGSKPPNSDIHMQGGKYNGGRGSPPPLMGGRYPGRGRDRGYASGPPPNDAWEEAPPKNRVGVRNRAGGNPRRQDGPAGRGGRGGGRGRDHGGRGPSGGHHIDGGEGFRGDSGRGRGRGRGQYGDFR